MNTFRKGLDLLLGAICCLVLAMMVGIACWQVVSRYILGVPSTLTEEMLRFLPGVGINAGHGFCRRSETAYQSDSLTG